MDRTIKFRGKPVRPYVYTVKEDGTRYVEFEYGGFYRDFCYGGHPEGKDYIISFNSTGLGYNEHVLVDKASVGQYTGLKDKNGKEIYEGDIVIAAWYSHDEPESDTTGEVVFNEGWLSFCIWNKTDKKMSEMNGHGYYTWEIEVIGNIYENPELLEG